MTSGLWFHVNYILGNYRKHKEKSNYCRYCSWWTREGSRVSYSWPSLRSSWYGEAQDTCIPLSVLYLENLTLNPCHRKNLENRSSNTPQVWGHYWDMSSQGCKSEGDGRGWEWILHGTFTAGHSTFLSSEEWRPHRHRTLFPGIVHQRVGEGGYEPVPVHQLTLVG